LAVTLNVNASGCDNNNTAVATLGENTPGITQPGSDGGRENPTGDSLDNPEAVNEDPTNTGMGDRQDDPNGSTVGIEDTNAERNARYIEYITERILKDTPGTELVEAFEDPDNPGNFVVRTRSINNKDEYFRNTGPIDLSSADFLIWERANYSG